MKQARRIKRLKLAALSLGLCAFALLAGATLIPLGEFQLPGTSVEAERLGEFQLPGTNVEAEREGQLPTTVFLAPSPFAGPALSATDEECDKKCEHWLYTYGADFVVWAACINNCKNPLPKPPPPRPPPDAGVPDPSATGLLLLMGLLGLCSCATLFRWILRGEPN